MIDAGYIAVLIAAVFYGLMRITHKPLARHGTKVYLTAFNTVGFLVLLPIVFLLRAFPSTLTGWLFLGGFGILLAVTQYLNVKSYEYLEPSVRESFVHFDLVLILVISSLFLGEIVGAREIIGVVFIVAGAALMTIPLGGFRKTVSNQGILLVIALVVFGAFIGPMNKIALQEVIVPMIMLVGYGVPLLLLLATKDFPVSRVKEFVQRERKTFAFSITCSLLAYSLMVWSLTRIPVNHASSIVRLSAVVGFVAAIIVFKEERSHLGLKTASLVLVLAGVFTVLSAGV